MVQGKRQPPEKPPQAPVGAPAPLVTDAPVDEDLRSQKVVRSGAAVMAVLWEE
ncbi:MAG: hypothetical protein HYS09_03820 [Chloroflexi bacterium]|nr:hypothetical protein [Chloroflexota bacterium]